MRWLNVLMARGRALFRREAVLDDIDEELRFHIELDTAANVARGMAPDEARARALRGFGNLGEIRDRAYDVRGGSLLEALWQDLRQGLRMLRRHPGFTCVAVLTLSLGIGANSAIFSVVNAVLLRPLPYPDADRLVSLRTITRTNGSLSNSALPDFRAWRDDSHAFAGLGAYYHNDFNLVGAGGFPERVQGALVTANLFAVLRVSPALGRGFTVAEEPFGRHRVVLLSDRLWQRRFGGDRGVLGRAVDLNGESYTVIGVMPAGMPFFDNHPIVDLWAPVSFAPGDSMDGRGNRFVDVVGRLRPQATLASAQAELDVIAARLARAFKENQGLGAVVLSLREEIVGELERTLLVLLGAVGLVLLVACLNVANLLLVRAAARQRELGVRISLGAGRARIVRQLLLESVPLGLLGGGAGLLLAVVGMRALIPLLPASLPRHNPVAIDGTVLAFTLVTTLVTVFTFALAPAVQAARTDLRAVLAEGGRSATAGRRRGRLHGLLVTGEVGLSLMLLIGAGLMLQTFVKLRGLDTGFRHRSVLTLRIPLPDPRYPYPTAFPVPPDAPAPDGLRFFQRLLGRVRTLPGVQAAGVSTALPLGAGMGWGKYLSVEGQRPAAALDQVPLVQFALISPGYLPAMGAALRRGRAITEQDSARSQPVALVNEAAARQLFHGDPLGKTIWMGPPEALLPALPSGEPIHFVRRTVVGILADLKGPQLRRPAKPEVFVPYTQGAQEGWTNAFMLAVHAGDAPEQLVGAIRDEVRALDPEQPITDIATMDARLERSLSQPRFGMALLGLFAMMALLLAALGVYGVTSSAVAQRTHEIGIRVALGAGQRDLLWLVLREGLGFTLAGVAVGLLGALGATRVLAKMLYGVSATDPWTFAAVPLLLVAAALAACLGPVRRATRVPAMLALRSEA
jgi:putative ABC transport system permease protein